MTKKQGSGLQVTKQESSENSPAPSFITNCTSLLSRSSELKTCRTEKQGLISKDCQYWHEG